MIDFEDKILGLIGRDDYKPLTLKGLARRLAVEDDAYPDLRAAAKRLAKAGKVDLGKDKTLRKPGSRAEGIVGTFKRNAKGFGFVQPATSKDKADAIFIPAADARDASTGDEVVVRLIKRANRNGNNAEGRIVQIVSRADRAFVGTYYELKGVGIVQFHGTTFADPIHVDDPGAKGAKHGDVVTVEMARYPTANRLGECVITEVLGARGAPGVDTLSVIRAFGIPDQFDIDVLDEAREQARIFAEDETKSEIGQGRTDLRDVLTITIDPATARDFDDAISLSRDDRGYWSLGVHIADVSHFVQPGTALEHTARLRGTSVYLPDRVIPMLPELISNNLASLQAGRTRYTLTAFIEFNAEGILTDSRFARTAIQVDHRFSYEQAFALMSDPSSVPEGVSPEIVGLLGRMLELARILRQRRKSQGALELSMPEVEIELGESGNVEGAHLASNDESHSVIEEFMLAANEAVATFLGSKEIGFLRRSHPDPEPSKLLEYGEFVRSLGIKLEHPRSRFELQRVLSESAGRPEAYAVHYGFLRSLKQAAYTPESDGHYALAIENYCHFTSPIRRYPDLQVHRQLTAVLLGKTPKSDLDELRALGQHCTKTERRAEAAERDVIKIKLLTYLKTQLGQTFHAVIVGVEEFGLFCRLVELPADGLIHVRTLGDDYYYREEGTYTLIGRRSGKRFRLGDKALVKITNIDIDRRELNLAFATPVRDEPKTTVAAKSKAKAEIEVDPAESNLPPSRSKRRPSPAKKAKPPSSAKKGGRKKRK